MTLPFFKSKAGTLDVLVTNVLLDGYDGTPGVNELETALDIEMALSMAPNLSSVIVYDGFWAISILNRMASDNIAKQLSSSWGYSMNASVLQAFQQFKAQGQVMFQASGDDGAYAVSVLPPIDNPDIVTVGGTELMTVIGGGPWVSETTWSESGGGISPSFAIPTWQQGVDMTTNQGSTTMRNIPDVALVSDGIYAIGRNGAQFVLAAQARRRLCGPASPRW